ncbi:MULTISPECIES: hypothetical protein [unclassified Haladaptatus]|uniref:DUF7521 family protein n=1 Tax=unclassified Haladaptatus TaxID=2622732 RepID=UPI0023E8F676|nr:MULTISPECIES: hypothetical protein [unclassified Haladaptatus]
MTISVTALVVLKTLTLVLGGLITYYAYKAYRRTESPALRALTVGFAIVTLGALMAGFADQVLRFDATTVALIESLLTTIGFAVLVYALYVE